MPYTCKTRGWRQFHFWSAAEDDRGVRCACCDTLLSRSGSMPEQVRVAYSHLRICDHDEHWVPDPFK